MTDRALDLRVESNPRMYRLGVVRKDPGVLAFEESQPCGRTCKSIVVVKVSTSSPGDKHRILGHTKERENSSMLLGLNF